MEHFYDQVSRGKRPRVMFSQRAWAPHVDVYEAAGQAVVLVELAGVPKDQIQIEVEGEQLTLRGERRPPHRGTERVFFALEVPYGAFERKIRLPFPVDAARAEASYSDGFLEIVLPGLTPQRPRRVSVQSAEPTER